MSLLYPSVSSSFAPPTAIYDGDGDVAIGQDNRREDVDSSMQQASSSYHDKENISSLPRSYRSGTKPLSASNSSGSVAALNANDSPSKSRRTSTPPSTTMKQRSRRSSAAHPRSPSGQSLESPSQSAVRTPHSQAAHVEPSGSSHVDVQQASSSGFRAMSSTSPISVASPATSVTPRGIASPPGTSYLMAESSSCEGCTPSRLPFRSTRNAVPPETEAARRQIEETVASVTAALERAASAVYDDVDDGYAGGEDAQSNTTWKQRPKRERTSTDGSSGRPRSRRSSNTSDRYRIVPESGSSSAIPPRCPSQPHIATPSGSSNRSRRGSSSARRHSRKASAGVSATSKHAIITNDKFGTSSTDGLDLGASLRDQTSLETNHLLEPDMKGLHTRKDSIAGLMPWESARQATVPRDQDAEEAAASWDSPRASRAVSINSSLLPPVHVRDFAFERGDPRFAGESLPPTPIALPDSDESPYGDSWMSPNSLNGHHGSLAYANGGDPSPSLSLLSSSSSSSLSSNFTPPPFGAFGTTHSFNYTGYRSNEGSSPGRQEQLALPKDGQWSTWGQSSSLSDNSDHTATSFPDRESGTPLAGDATEYPRAGSNQSHTVSALGVAGSGSASGEVPQALLTSALTIHPFDIDSDEEDENDDYSFAEAQNHDQPPDPGQVDFSEQASQDSFTHIPPGGLLYRVKYSFVAETDSEMQVVEGDIVRVWQQSIDGWVLGARVNRTAASAHNSNPADELELCTGLVPQSYLVLAQDFTPCG